MSVLAVDAGKPKMMHVVQGDFAVSDDPSVVMTTILGSCVATALHDPVRGIGGLNHFLLPGNSSSDQGQVNYGVNAMELLINALLKQGARKDRLQAKLFGGARVVKGLSEIGQRNGEFAREFLAKEGIACCSASLGGTQARRIRYWPATQRAQQLLVADTDAPPVVHTPIPPSSDVGNDVELF